MYPLLLGVFAGKAAAEELHISPKPGLVDPTGNGSHADMDYWTFLWSLLALSAHWKEQAAVGFCKKTSDIPDFVLLRQNGLRMERAMFLATGGVNTHKGLIFALSLLLYGAGKTLASRIPLDASEICCVASQVVSGCVSNELESLKSAPPHRPLSHGEQLYLNHGITGIRGEAEQGFPSVLSEGLPALEKALARGASFNDASLHALLSLMLSCEDSNVIYRAGFDFWKKDYREAVAQTLESFDPVVGDHTPILRLARFLVECHVSPGGAADLLACTLFLHHCSSLLVSNSKTLYISWKQENEKGESFHEPWSTPQNAPQGKGDDPTGFGR